MAFRFASVSEEQILLINSADYLTRVVYTKTIIPLGVGESGGYFPPISQSLSVNDA